MTQLDTDAMAQSVVLAIKTALVPVQARAKALHDQVIGLEARWSDLNALRERLAVVETKAVPVVEKGEKGDVGDPGPVGVAGPQGDIGPIGPVGEQGLAGRDGLAGVQGPQGLNGRDGTLEHMKVVQLDDRTWQLCFKNGDPIEGGMLHFDSELYRGVWVANKTYERGDGVTWDGGEWHCNKQTVTKPGDSSKDWTLKVKRGRDGKDGRDAVGLPVVKTR